MNETYPTPCWRTRVQDELRELHERMKRLAVFCDSPAFSALHTAHRCALDTQYAAMTAYANALHTRLAL